MARMDHELLRRRLIEIVALKALPRAGWLRVGVAAPESVAAHAWGVAWLVLVLAPPTLDRGRALAIAVIHDLAEVRVGDITPFDGVSAEDKAAREEVALRGLLAGLPDGDGLLALWREYEAGGSPEARFVKACDRLDMALQARAYAATAGIDPAAFIDSALAGLGDGLLRALAGESLS